MDLFTVGILCRILELCLRNLNALASYNLITMDEDINIKTTGEVLFSGLCFLLGQDWLVEQICLSTLGKLRLNNK